MVGTRSLSSGAHSRDPLALPTLHSCHPGQVDETTTSHHESFVTDRLQPLIQRPFSWWQRNCFPRFGRDAAGRRVAEIW